MKSKQLIQHVYATTFVLTLILMPLGSSNAAKSIFGQQIFNLQKRQAEKGNTLAQFKLGTFYEYGISVEKNSDIAKVWYIKAAKKKYMPAQDRLTYLDIKERGYNEYAHAEWFKKISNEAKKEKANSLIILGQMHHNGIIVKKNLPEALNLMRRASLRSHAEVDGEIAEIRSKIDTQNKILSDKIDADKVSTEKPVAKKNMVTSPSKITKKPVKKRLKKPTKKLVKKIIPVSGKTNSSKSEKTSKITSKKISLAEKERRYKEALWKIHQETMLLEQTQNWSEDDEDEDENEDSQ